MLRARLAADDARLGELLVHALSRLGRQETGGSMSNMTIGVACLDWSGMIALRMVLLAGIGVADDNRRAAPFPKR